MVGFSHLAKLQYHHSNDLVSLLVTVDSNFCQSYGIIIKAHLFPESAYSFTLKKNAVINARDIDVVCISQR